MRSSSRPAAKPCSMIPRLPCATAAQAVMAAAIIARAAGELGRPPPRIAVIADDELADNFIDGLHTLGHCFVSLSRSEGFGLGGFDAATHGRPVIAVGYGGPLDYLGADWRGRVPHRMTPAENLSGYEWFDDGHFWPEPDDAAAFALMREFAADPAPFRAEAEATSIRIRKDFGAEAVTRPPVGRAWTRWDEPADPDRGAGQGCDAAPRHAFRPAQPPALPACADHPRLSGKRQPGRHARGVARTAGSGGTTLPALSPVAAEHGLPSPARHAALGARDPARAPRGAGPFAQPPLVSRA